MKNLKIERFKNLRIMVVVMVIVCFLLEVGEGVKDLKIGRFKD